MGFLSFVFFMFSEATFQMLVIIYMIIIRATGSSHVGLFLEVYECFLPVLVNFVGWRLDFSCI